MTRGTEIKVQEGGAAPASQERVAAASEQQPVLENAIVLERKKKGKKGKKKYARGTKWAQRLLFGMSKAGYRVTNSVAEGLNTFAKESNKSGRKRRDGMIRDALQNASRGASDGMRELGKAPGEVTRRVPTGRAWRIVRVFAPLTPLR